MSGARRGRPWLSGALALVVGLGGSVVVLGIPAAAVPATTGTVEAAPTGVASAPLAAAPGNPGVPGDPVELYSEDFENTPDGSNVLLSGYTGAQGATYSAAAFWVNRVNCNGFVVDWTSPRNTADCTGVANAATVFNNMLAIPHALGQLQGVVPTTNGAAASYTAAAATGAQIQFQSSQIALPVANRFVTFSVDAGAMNCGVSAPLLRFYLLDQANTEIPVSSAPINVCTDPRGTTYTGVPTPNGTNQTVRAGSFAANGSALVTGSTLAVRMRNQNSAANGNDGAYDNIQVLDVSPQLDKSFSPISTVVGGTSRLTLTVTNTSELAAKDGWAFTDNLPAGLIVASTPDVTNDCGATVGAAAGAAQVVVTGGSLAAGREFCTIAVDVTSRTIGSYTNGPDAFFPTTGVNLPGEATVEFTPLVGAPACPTPAFLFQGSPSASPIEIDLVTGETTEQTALAQLAFNGVGYSELADGFFGFDHPTDELYFVSPDYATVQNLGSPDYSNVSFTYAQLFPSGIPIGDVSPDGILYVSSGGGPTRPWMAVDVDQDSPTFLQVLDGGTVPAPAAPINAGLDWVYNPADGRLYSFGINTGNDNVFLYAFDPANPSDGYVQVGNLGALVAPNGVPAVGNQASSAPFGATYSSPRYLYGANNQTGQIWRVPVTDPTTATFFAYGPGPSSDNDGARCASAPIWMDLGDAPDSYGTTLSADGARHGLVGYDTATNTAPLMLGDANTVDADDDGVPTGAADGDDTAGVDDEGAVADPITMTTGAEATVSVTVTNDTDEAATLAAWADLDRDGTFEDGERVTVDVDAASGTVDHDVTFPAATSPGDTFARFRLFAGDVADPSPTGAVSGGEVEDYPVTVQAEPLVCDALYAVQSNSPWNLYSVDTASGTLTPEHQFAPTGGINALGISADGRYGFSHSGTNVFVYDTETDTTQTFTTGQNVVATHGAVDRATGVYYYGNVSGSTALVYGFDPGTGTDLGQVAAVDLPGAPGANGDWAFDTAGNLYLSAGESANNVYLAPGPLPATAPPSPVALSGTLLGDVTTSDPINGLAVDVAGYIYLGSGSTLYQVNPSSGTIVAQPALSPSGQSVDLASCATPATIEVLKDVVDRRTPDDQFTVTISGGGLPGNDAATGTTTGTDLGIQDEDEETGGIVLGLVGETYTVTETAAGATDLANYTTTWECVNGTDGDAVIASGDGAQGEFVMPPANAEGVGAAVLCTFTNDDLPVPGLAITKSAEPVGEVLPGGTVTYTVTVENTGETTYDDADPATFTDDLTEVLDDATWDDDASADVGVVSFSEPNLTWTGGLAPGESATITYSVTVDDPVTGDSVLENRVVGPGESNCAEGSDDPACSTDTPVRALDIAKTAEPAGEVLPGGTVTYTVTVTNTGQVDYTAATPATFTDDLTTVLDDATWDDTATATVGTVTYAEPTLAWSGALAAGATATVTYSVTVDDPLNGDGTLTNAVVGPSESGCDDGTEPGCSTDTPVRALEITKVADVAEVVPGGTVTYTVTVENTGQAAYDATTPATFTDDLTAVLDDATWDASATADAGAVVYAEPVVAWSGPLAPGETATITYAVTVDDPDTGDGSLTNAVVGPPESGCDDGTEPDCSTDTPVRALTITKEADVAEVLPGGTVTYTVTVENTGQVAYDAATPATFTDDLTAVLDDATWDDDATASAGTVSYAEPVVSWSGPLAVGAAATITYSVTVDDPMTGDGTLTNAVVGPPESGCDDGTEPGCSTDTPVRALEITKSADVTEVVPGGTVTYTVTVENTGQVAYDATTPATFTDDLTAVLDDATWAGTTTADVGAVAYAEPVVSWSGPLAPGETATITYAVTVDDPPTGDGVLTNAVVGPPESGCDDGTEPGCSTDTPVRSLEITKVADVAEVVPGGTVTYTVTVENTGQVPYTALDPATFDDDLTEVLDDATWADDASADVGTVTYAEPTLSWSGPLGVGETATVTYSVTVDDPDTGDAMLTNTVVGPPESGCDDGTEPGCSTDTPVRALTITKEADVTEVIPGATVTYTVTVENTGQVDYAADAPATFDDDLTEVLDDATWDDDASADVGTVTYTEPTLGWSGPLAVGETATITYSVTVDDPITGDGQLVNVVVGPPESNCDTGEEDGCVVPVPDRQLDLDKTADVTETVPGGTVTYTVTVTNTGEVAYDGARPATFVDDLSDVLDDATFDDASADVGDVSFTDPVLSWSGPLAPGESATVTYAVVVDDPLAGDGTLTNAVVGPPESDCDAGADPDEAAANGCTTDTPVRALTITKEADVAEVLPGGTVTYTVTVENTGQVPYTALDPATFDDDLSGVLDDTTWDDDATASAGAVSYAEPVLSWSGPLAVGATATVTYSVTVDDPPAGDGTLTNAVVGPPESGCDDGTEPGCTTDTPVRSLTLTKTSDVTDVQPGETVTYTIEVTNTGQADYDDALPATFTDDLTQVLDDATWDGTATATEGAVDYAEPVLSWSGPLAVGDTVTVTYTLTVNDPDTGDGVLVNGVVGPPESNCDTGFEDDCSHVVPSPDRELQIVKTAELTGPVPAGGTVTYTVRVTNSGDGRYTAGTPATFTDVLDGVLDDATWNDDVRATVGEATYAEPELSWAGPLEPGETAVVTYSVTVNDPMTGDGELANAVLGPAESNCPVVMPSGGGGAALGVSTATPDMPPGCQVRTPVQAFEVAKTVDVTDALPGDTVTYTVTVTSTGQGEYTDDDPVVVTDDLADVLDDATPAGTPTVTAGDVILDGTTLTWSGPLAVGGTVTLTYAVTVDDPDTGDGELVNVVVPADGSGGSCADDTACTTTTEVTTPPTVPPTVPPTAPPGTLPQTGPAWVLALLSLSVLLVLAGIALRRRSA